jgi:cytochrome oxidase assembly protein ShyY1
VALILVAACIQLGRWQWQRTQDILVAERVSASVPVAVQDVNAAGENLPAESIGRPVFAEGTYRQQGQIVVLHRFSADEVPGSWILTPLDLADGSTIAVLRGWVPDGSAPGSMVPTGPVRVTGIMHPGETFYPDADPPPGTALAISDEVKQAAWGPGSRDGFIMLVDQEPGDAPVPAPVPSTVQTGDVAFPLQNFFYSFQWWIFAVFIASMYARWLWLDALGSAEEDVPRLG